MVQINQRNVKKILSVEVPQEKFDNDGQVSDESNEVFSFANGNHRWSGIDQFSEVFQIKKENCRWMMVDG
jgi:hypothetical protein